MSTTNGRKRLRVAGLALAVSLVVGGGVTGLVVATANPYLLKGGQLGSLAWYSNNYQANVGPRSLVYDGTNIWSANGVGTVTKVNAVTGAVIGSYWLPQGHYPYAIAFDGSSIWTVNYFGASVSKFNASTGAVLGTYLLPATAGPTAIAFDGGNIWTANAANNTLSKVSTSGTIISTTTLPAFSRPSGLVFDGAYLWVANNGTSSVSKVDTSSGAVLGTYSLPYASSPIGIAFDGLSIWTANNGTSTVSKISTSGVVVGTYSLPAGSGPTAIAFDQPGFSLNPTFLDPKTYVWTVNNLNRTVTKIDTATGAVVGLYPTGVTPNGIAFDGTNIWVANSGNGALTKIQAR